MDRPWIARAAGGATLHRDTKGARSAHQDVTRRLLHHICRRGNWPPPATTERAMVEPECS
eukprot:2078784-Prymnesium_polylepis.1